MITYRGHFWFTGLGSKIYVNNSIIYYPSLTLKTDASWLFDMVQFLVPNKQH